MHTVTSVLEDLTKMGQIAWSETGEEITDGPHVFKGLQATVGNFKFTIRGVNTKEKRGSWLDKILGTGLSVFYALTIENLETKVSVTYTDDPEVIPGKKEKTLLGGIKNVDPGQIAARINWIVYSDTKETPESLRTKLVECLDPELRQGEGEPKAH